MKKRFGFSKNTIIYTGRLAPEKHIDVIIRAVAIVKKIIPDITLAITGLGNAEKSLRSLAQKLGIAGNVKFLGFVENSILPLVYKASDVFAVMSTAESQCLSLMQAMATGLPSVGADWRALPEYIDKKSGIIVPVGDYTALSEAILKILSDRNLASEFGAGGIKVAAQCDPDAVAQKWEEIYQSAINKKSDKNFRE